MADVNELTLTKEISPQYLQSQNLLVQAQIFVNYLISQPNTAETLKQKLKTKDNIQHYLKEENLNAYKLPLSSQDDTSYFCNPEYISFDKGLMCLYTIPYNKLNLQIGFAKQYHIEAGKDLTTVVEIERQ